MALVRDARWNLAKREADIDRARNLVRGRFEEFDGVGAALVTVAEGAPESWITWSGMADNAGTVASALQRGRAALVASGQPGAVRLPGGTRLTAAVSLLERLEEFLGEARP